MSYTMSYTGAGKPAPAAGTDASYGFYRAMFDHVFAQHNSLVSAGIIKDVNGGFNATYAGLIPTGNFVGMNVGAGSAYTGVPYFYSKAGMTEFFQVGNDASVHAPAFHGPADNVAAGAIIAASIAAGQIGTSHFAAGAVAPLAAALAAVLKLDSLVSDYKVVPGAAGQVNVSAGDGYVDTAGTIIFPTAMQICALSNTNSPTQPTGSQSQLVEISLAPVTNTPVATGGTVGVSPGTPTHPPSNRAIALVLWRGTTANPSNTVAVGDITNLRSPGAGGAGSGSSSVDSTARAIAAWVVGSGGVTYPSAKNSTVNQGGGTSYMHGGNIRTSQYGGGYDQLGINSVQGDIMTLARMNVSGGTVTIHASPAWKCSANINGEFRSITSDVVVTGSGLPTGTVFLVLDFSNAAPANDQQAWNPQLIATTPNSNQMVIRRFYWSSGSLIPIESTSLSGGQSASGVLTGVTNPDHSDIISINSLSLSNVLIFITDNLTTPSAATPPSAGYGNLSNLSPSSFVLASDAKLQIRCCFYGNVTIVGSVPIQFAPLIDGVALQGYATFATYVINHTYTGESIFWEATTRNPVPKGAHTLHLGVLTSVGSTSTYQPLAGGSWVEANVSKG